jgi:hypothetical protein
MELDVIARLIEVVGLDQVMNMLGMPPSVKRELKEVERRLGKETAVQALIAALDMIGRIHAGETGPPIPRPPPRKAKPFRRGKAKRGNVDDPDDDDPLADELDLW